jgi:saccharopine dehydrogenase-like NADP-dependent oxidoreductase
MQSIQKGTPMKVLIVGAGMQGHVLTWNLARCPEVTELVVADYDEGRARFVAEHVGGGKARPLRLDAADADAVTAAAAGAKLGVNAVIPEYNQAIMRGCLRAGANYMDMAAGQTQDKNIDEAFLEQLALAEEFQRAGLTALLCTGMDPGVTNTLAGNGYEDLDRCYEIRIKDYSIFDSPVPLQVWSQETYYTDCAQPPLLFEDGEFKRVEIFGRREVYQFPKPWGMGTVICHDHEEVSTLPRMLPAKFGQKGLRYVDFKMGMPVEAIDADVALVSSGMASKNPVVLRDGRQVRPVDVLVANLPPNPPVDEIVRLALSGAIVDEGVVTVDCIGEISGKPASIGYIVVPPDIKWVNERIPGATMVSYGTSTPAAIYAELLAKEVISEVGILVPEILPRAVRDIFVAEMGRRGLAITRRFETRID